MYTSVTRIETYFGVSLAALSAFQFIQIQTVMATIPIITGSIILHLPFAPSNIMSIVEMNIPKNSTPLNPVSTPPWPYAGSPVSPARPLLINPNPVSPPVTYSIPKNMKLNEYKNSRNAEIPRHILAGIDSILNIFIKRTYFKSLFNSNPKNSCIITIYDSQKNLRAVNCKTN